MKAWNIYLNGKLQDTVFYVASMTKTEVWDSLTIRGEYSRGIVVKEAKR